MKRWVYVSIFIMTIMDAVLTTTGANLGYIEEANPFVVNIFNHNPVVTALLAVIFSSAMLWVIYRFQHKIRWINYALVTLFIVKVGVIGLHVRWIIAIV